MAKKNCRVWAASKVGSSLTFRLLPIPISTTVYKSEEEKATLAANLIEDTKSIGNQQFTFSTLRHLLKEESVIDEVQSSHVLHEPFIEINRFISP